MSTPSRTYIRPTVRSAHRLMHAQPRRGARRGIALAIALFAIVIIGAMVAGIFFVSTQEFRIGRNNLAQPTALGGAEYGQTRILNDWDRAWNTRLRKGDTLLRVYTPMSGAVDTVRVTKLGDLLYHVVSEARVGQGAEEGARRRTSSLLKLRIPEINILGAVTTRGVLEIDQATINGADTPPTGWDCPPPGPAVAAVATSSAGDLQFDHCIPGECLQGNPRVLVTPAAADTNTYFTYGGLKWADLVAMATRTYAADADIRNATPSVSGGVCNTGNTLNLGDPNRNAVTPGACESFFPVVHAQGSLRLRDGVGQGILLVENDLRLDNFQWYGLVIVRGELRAEAAGAISNIRGAVMAANLGTNNSGSDESEIDESNVTFSRCAVVKSLIGMALPARAKQRAWSELF